MPTLFGFRWGMMDVDSGQDLTYYDFVLSIFCKVMRIESLGGDWRMVHGIKHIALFSSHAPWVQ
jgi:hypothetical protein